MSGTIEGIVEASSAAASTMEMFEDEVGTERRVK